MTLKLEMASPEKTKELAQNLAPLLKDPSLILLYGDLGSGKTFFTSALAEALGSGEDVSSPTFTLENTYSSPEHEIHHFDLYRISDADELYAIGFDDQIQSGINLIEWPEVAEIDSDADIIITISYLGEDSRIFELQSDNKQLLEELKTYYE